MLLCASIGRVCLLFSCQYQELTGDDSEMELELLETFIDSTRQELDKYNSAVRSNNTRDAEIYSHSIKGASKYVGASRVRYKYYRFIEGHVFLCDEMRTSLIIAPFALTC